jgi:hypothetical protein
MPTGTTYNPPNMNYVVKSALLFDAQGVSATITAGQVQNLDYLLSDDCLITGASIITNNGNYGDYVSFQIVDTTGFTGAAAGTVLNQFATNWHLPPNADDQFDVAYPAKLIAGLTVRVVYTSTGGSDVFFAINYKFHKVLV